MTTKKFQIDQEETEEAYLLFVSGELDLSVTAQLNAALDPIVSCPDKILILDLKNLKYIDSTGIGIIISVLKIRVAIQAKFIVREIPPAIKRLFDLTGISGFLTEAAERGTS